MLKTYKILFALLLILCGSLVQAQWLKTNGKKIVDNTGNEIILRGMGLGGWMIQEGYMMETSNFAGPQHEIKAKIISLIGLDSTEKFYKTWHQNHCTKGDIDSLASWGFNSIRVPLHYNLFTLPIEQEPVPGSNTWLDEGFALVDSLFKWCTPKHIYVILDMHATPGGQGRDANISDYDNTKPSLWESEANKNKLKALWVKLAERYKDEPWLGGYDLINEPNWNFTAGGNQNGCSENTNAPLRQLMMDITSAIRNIDNKHIIIIEGNCWGNNYNGVLPPWDNNMVLSFHKYWSYNDLGSIQGIMNLRNTYSMPIWCGESGENSNPWFTDAISLFENNSIGWSWWPLKKVNSVVNPFTITKNAGYQELLNYWQNGGVKPTAEFAMNALMQLAENARVENCTFRKDYIDAMFRQVQDSLTIPYSHQTVPGIIHASDFDLGRNGKAYSDKDVYNYQVSAGSYTNWNNGWSYRNDAVDIEPCLDTDPDNNGYSVGWTSNDEWMLYTVQVDSSAAYNLKIRFAGPIGTNAQIRILCNDADVSSTVNLPATGGSQSWNNIMVNDVILYKGTQKIKLYFEKGGANIEFLKFTLSKKLSDMSFLPVSAETGEENSTLLLSLNKHIDPSSVSKNGFSCTVNSANTAVTSVYLNPLNPLQLVLSLNGSIVDSDTLKISYSDGSITSEDSTLLSDFANLPVRNRLPIHYAIPGKIEAENFFVNHGLQTETTTDVGGGLNIGYTNAGDYLDYRIRVIKRSLYRIDARIACNSSAGTVQFQQIDTAGNILHSRVMNVPVTGGWQTWKTISDTMTMEAGIGKLRVVVMKPEYNLNWYSFTSTAVGMTESTEPDIRIYPNPAHNEFRLEIQGSAGMQKNILIYSSTGTLIQSETLNPQPEEYTIRIHGLTAGLYWIQLNTNGRWFRSKLMVI